MPHHRTAFVAAILTAFLAGAPTLGAESRSATTANAVAPRISIDNFGRISDTYYRGAQPDDEDYAALAKLGVKTVIDLQADGLATEAALVKAAGMRYERIAMTTRVEPTPQQLAAFLALVNDPANQPVYVHCAGGRHRTGVMTAVYRMTHDAWSPEQAFKEMKQYKFGADFLHPEFKRFVHAYRVEPAPRTAPVLAIATTAAQ